jgi:hypothetical protein
MPERQAGFGINDRGIACMPRTIRFAPGRPEVPGFAVDQSTMGINP